MKFPAGASGTGRVRVAQGGCEWHKAALVLYLDGANVRPVITPDDTDRVAAVLSAHGVNVTAGREPGLI